MFRKNLNNYVIEFFLIMHKLYINECGDHSPSGITMGLLKA